MRGSHDSPARPRSPKGRHRLEAAAGGNPGAGFHATESRDLLQPEHVDLNLGVRHAEAVIHFATGKGIEVEFDLSPEIGAIFADARRVEQVLMNLVLNARDAMPDGGYLTIATTSNQLGSECGVRHGVTPKPG